MYSYGQSYFLLLESLTLNEIACLPIDADHEANKIWSVCVQPVTNTNTNLYFKYFFPQPLHEKKPNSFIVLVLYCFI